MGHSAQFQSEILVRKFESQAELLLEQAAILRKEGLLDIGDQLVVQHGRLLDAIEMLRNLKD